ncbi:MAG: hypothetical protein Q8S31_04250 [Alphaproteobacteria bacterium]|nr:hypothetical protein [Alphaproteobacteria bacterium]
MYESYREEAIKFRLTEPDESGPQDIVHFSALVELILIGLVSAIIESVLFTLLVKDVIGILLTLLGHVLLVGALFLWVIRRYHKHSGLRIALLLTLSTCFLGPFGAVGTFISVIMFVVFQKSSQSFMEWYKSIFPDTITVSFDELHLNLKSGRERPDEAATVSSFIDIISKGNTKQKQAAIQIITHNFHPSFAIALKIALKDMDPVVRVQAASAVTAIERKYVNKLHELEEHYLKNKNFLSTAQLADQFDEYGNLGLMDKERERETKNKSLMYFLEAYKIKNNDRHVLLAIGRLLLKQGKTLEAYEWFKKILEDGLYSTEILAWTIECLFKLKMYDALRDFIQTHRDKIDLTKLHENVKEFVTLWMGNSIKPTPSNIDPDLSTLQGEPA